MNDKLTVVDIGNFCLLKEKYKAKIEEAGMKNNTESNKMFLDECSKLVSGQLKIMDDCQKMLYKFGYRKENVEQMKKIRDLFQEGIESMQSVLKSFDIAINEIPE